MSAGNESQSSEKCVFILKIALGLDHGWILRYQTPSVKLTLIRYFFRYWFGFLCGLHEK
jgi:hypothetical protein